MVQEGSEVIFDECVSGSIIYWTGAVADPDEDVDSAGTEMAASCPSNIDHTSAITKRLLLALGLSHTQNIERTWQGKISLAGNYTRTMGGRAKISRFSRDLGAEAWMPDKPRT